MNPLDKMRGHRLLPEVMAGVPRLYETEELPFAEKVIHVRFFTNAGSAEWLLAEWDGTDVAFGWCCLGDRQMAEWGYFSLEELASLYTEAHGFPIWVERDLNFLPKRFAEVQPSSGS